MREERFNCKKCNVVINGHNQYCHDGMCDDCFFEEYFPEDAQIFEIDAAKIKDICKRNEKDNMKFWKFLKTDELDQRRFSKIVKEIEEKIDCTECANCCELIKPTLNEEDIKRISKHLNLTKESFISKYLVRNENNELEFNRKPCVFLIDNKCKIYELRPEECRKYPHLDKDISFRCHQFFNNAEICPIVFNVLENAKEEFLEDIYAFENPDI